jgi:hypothetical protein
VWKKRYQHFNSGHVLLVAFGRVLSGSVQNEVFSNQITLDPSLLDMSLALFSSQSFNLA